MSPQTVRVHLALQPTESDVDRQRAELLTTLLPQNHIAIEYRMDLKLYPMKNLLSLDDSPLSREIATVLLHHSQEAVQQQVRPASFHARQAPRVEFQPAILLDQGQVMFDQQL